MISPEACFWTRSRSNAISNLAQEYDWQHNPLAHRICSMLFDVFNDFYRDGKVPAVPDYFGRSDL